MTQPTINLQTEPGPALDIVGSGGSLAHRVHAALRRAILDLSFPPGAVLSKNALALRLGVSRSPVSDALVRLSEEGLVEIVPQSATRVSRLSILELHQETFLREAIERAAASRVALSCEPDQLVQLSRNLRLQALLVEDGDTAGFFEADLGFHDLILGFTGFPRVPAAARMLSLQLLRARMLVLPEIGRPAATLEEHEAILQAIRARDPDAAKAAMSRHLGQLISRLIPLERQHPDYFRTP